MSMDSDVIVDRRRMRRKLTFWRVAAVVIAIAAIAGVGLMLSPSSRGTFTTSGSIARVNIEGLIRSDRQRVEALERLEKSQAAAVIVHINSPGGTTAGSEQLYDALVRPEGEEAPGRGGRGPRRFRRLHHRDRRRSHHRAAKLAGRLHRRPVPVSEFFRAA